MSTLKDVTPQLCESLWNDVCNWGRWGDDDQLGALNLIDGRKRLQALACVRDGICVGLGNPWPVAPSPHNPWPAEHRMLRAGDDSHYPGVPGLSVALDYIGVQHHGIACAHVDALCHVFVNDRMYNDFPASDVKSTGAQSCDISPMSNGIVSRGVLLDLAVARGANYLNGFDRISPADLDQAAAQQGVMVEPRRCADRPQRPRTTRSGARRSRSGHSRHAGPSPRVCSLAARARGCDAR